MIRRRLSAVLLAAATGTTLLAVGPTASAAPTKRCYDRMACFYYNSNQQGAIATIFNGGANLDHQIFSPDSGPGSRQKVEDNTASWDSRTRNTAFCVHRDRWWKGPYNSLKPQARKNLTSSLKNKNSSTNWYPRHEGGGGH
ncbi:hypothetical protein GCM10010313_67680 [Streptomyces violarus]|uniref:Peptidase inhibitor family I36 n=1 Tax=Streptomyces violarus TaxID=67380 RepID=A0A7W5F684_9ACTN|nr:MULTISPECIES: hypothetical protein [Streptomyces]MBB3081393.1 hypothetical protein [Streptomyces violarus]WRU02639.1 hypothetical protein VJ737_35360 [Streptomyces sp. CGMCC 4.1772]GHD27717.1 hypothetical protein GCM10010313_67680 [Streptomyces violarus]